MEESIRYACEICLQKAKETDDLSLLKTKLVQSPMCDCGHYMQPMAFGEYLEHGQQVEQKLKTLIDFLQLEFAKYKLNTYSYHTSGYHTADFAERLLKTIGEPVESSLAEAMVKEQDKIDRKDGDRQHRLLIGRSTVEDRVGLKADIVNKVWPQYCGTKLTPNTLKQLESALNGALYYWCRNEGVSTIPKLMVVSSGQEVTVLWEDETL